MKLSGKVKAKPNEQTATFSGNTKRKKSKEHDASPRLSVMNASSFRSSFMSAKLSNNSELLSKIEDREEEVYEKSALEVLRLKLKRFLAYSIYGFIYEWSLHLLSIISCVLFIYQTYLTPEQVLSARIEGVNYLEAIEVITAGIFSFDFLVALFIADHRWEHLRR